MHDRPSSTRYRARAVIRDHLFQPCRGGYPVTIETRCVRIERHFQHTIALMAEELERLLDVIERKLMRDERRQVDTPRFGHRHQPAHALLPARAECRDDLLIPEAGIERLVGGRELP